MPTFDPIKEGEPYFEEVMAYTDHFVPMLEAEQAEDEAVLRERLRKPVQKLEAEGYCIREMNAYWLEAPKEGKHVAVFRLGPGITLPHEHKFTKGTQVLISRFDPLKEEPKRGSIFYDAPSELQIAFLERFDIEPYDDWRVDIGRSDVVFERMKAAVKGMNHDLASQEATSTNSTGKEMILTSTGLRDVLLRTFSPPIEEWENPVERTEVRHETNVGMEGLFREDARIVSWARRYSELDPVAVEGDPLLEGLNATQIRATAMMVNNRACLVQGPPGTGKTKTIIETIKLLKTHFRVPHPILICTYTNAAVDNLLEGLIASSTIRPLRVGAAGQMKVSLSPYGLENQIAAHPRAADLEQIRKQIEALRLKKQVLKDAVMDYENTNAGKGERHKIVLDNMLRDAKEVDRRYRAARARDYAVYMQILTEVVHSADVVCTTCLSAGARQLTVIDFPMVLVDEASMSTEPATLIPLMKGSRHVALIGDHKQLPPVITSPEAQARGLGVSLFERLAEEKFLPSIMLDIQYRMHPTISRFPSNEFYNKAVKDGTVSAHGIVSPSLIPPYSAILPQLESLQPGEKSHRPSVVFIDHLGGEASQDRSRVNWHEADIVCALVEDLLLRNPHMRGTDIGIIAPYVAQISLLTRLFNTDPKYKARFEAVLGQQRAMDLRLVEIRTVDGYEGREKDVIIFSTVRNNASGHIGFLADKRRLNVGLTRAKRGLFVVGSISTLRKGKAGGGEDGSFVMVGKGSDTWRRYAEYLSEEKLIVTLRGERLRRVLYGNLDDANSVAQY
ncbi:P-loop containing nucleoside triphosphate hydrolase protein [Trametopsis cervina]|nr:P-loop containing nucleoside triphosphate hydrolase protein [Trametopsis cervina]